MTSKIKLTFLGTSAQIPSVNRNHTAILLNYEGENILFDCGEGTQRQFRKARLNPCKITKIVISHLHADHILGLPGLLSTLALSDYKKNLIIYGPKGIKEFMSDFFNLFRFKREYDIKVEEVSNGKFFETEDFYLECEKMQHGIFCNAYNFVKKGLLRIDKNKLKKSKLIFGPHLQKLKQGKNISFEGKKYLFKDLTYKEKDKKISIVLDTLDNKKIVPFIRNADIFVCEASYGGELSDMAKEHMHMTCVQASKNAKKGKVDKLLLTHVSQRYEKNLKEFLKPAKNIFNESYLVRDLDSFEI